MKTSRSPVVISALLLIFAIALPASGETHDRLKFLGRSHLSKLGFSIYTATLKGEVRKLTLDQRLSLQLTYHRNLYGSLIENRTVNEWKHLGLEPQKIENWKRLIQGVFPDVNDGDFITAHYDPSSGIRFVLNNKEQLARIDNPEFGRDFLSIWLSPDTSEPAMRRKLWGLPH